MSATIAPPVTRPVPLRSLLLDPNNYRFVDQPEYVQVDESRLADPQVQRRTQTLLAGSNASQISDLLDSFRSNGWLPVDQVQVRPYEGGRYVVIEGNRRVAALKYLQERYATGADLGKLAPDVFDNVPVVTYQDSDRAHYLVLMGLKHVSGNKKWPALNQAKMLRELVSKHQVPPDTVCKSLGVTKRALNLALRTLALIDVYLASDYGDQFKSDQYNLFREVLNAPKIRQWIGWDESSMTASLDENLRRLFSWVSREEGDDAAEPREPAIVTTANMRELEEIIGDPKALERLDATRSISRAREGSAAILRNQAREALDTTRRSIHALFTLADTFSEVELDEVEAMVKSLRGVSAARNRYPDVIQEGISSLPPFNQLPAAHFSRVVIERYRGHAGTVLDGLRRINLLAGLNNAGKTTALEAVHLLAMQHDEGGVLGIVRQRGRVDARPDPRWIVEQLPGDVLVSGCFDGHARNRASVRLSFGREDDVEDQAFYLGSLAIEARYGDRAQHSKSDFYQNRDRRTHREGGHVLCRSVLYSPFSTGDAALLEACNKRSIEANTKERILEFLRANVDDGIANVEMVDTWRRFMVNHRRIERGIDLTQLGDGVQRVFLMCLLFAWAQHGVVLLDEFENAIHATLLPSLARFISELSREFNVQVFLTSHSKEAIDAIVRAELGADLSAYSLRRGDAGIRAELFPGERVVRLLEIADLDLRKV